MTARFVTRDCARILPQVLTCQEAQIGRTGRVAGAHLTLQSSSVAALARRDAADGTGRMRLACLHTFSTGNLSAELCPPLQNAPPVATPDACT